MARSFRFLIPLLLIPFTIYAALKKPLVTLTLRLQRCELTELIKDIQRNKLTRDHIELMDRQRPLKHVYTQGGRPIDLSNIPFMEFYRTPRKQQDKREYDDLNRLVCSNSPYAKVAHDNEWDEYISGS